MRRLIVARPKDGELLVQARAALQSLWKRCATFGFRGRCWGSRMTSSVGGSNIVLCDGKTVVVIYQDRGYGRLQVKTFGDRYPDLEEEVIELLEEAELWPED